MYAYSAVGYKVEDAVVVDLTYDMNCFFACIGWNTDEGNRSVGIVDYRFGGSDFRLLPPAERKFVAVGVF